jgi:plastocyanin
VGLFRKSDREALGAAAAVFSLIALLLAFSTLVVVIADDDSGGGGAGAVGGVTVGLKEFAIEPKTLEVDEGAKLTVVNNGSAEHNLAITGEDKQTKNLMNGDTDTLDLSGLEPGEYEIFCAISGHKEAGMRGTLAIGVPLSPASEESGSAGATAQELLASNDADDALQAEPVNAYVGQLGKIVEKFVAEGELDATLYEPNTEFPLYENDDVTTNPLLGPPIMPFTMDGDTKVFELTASVIDWQVDPETTVSAWAYNGTVPGPTMKLEPGEKVRVIFKNELPQSSAVHWHGLDSVPAGMDGVPFVTQDVVKPGAEFVYEFNAPDEPMSAMYHSHHHGEHQIPDGLFGAILVGDYTAQIQAVTGKAAADARIPFVLNDAGVIGLSFNGKSFPATAPVVARVGQWVQIEYYNEGLQIHPMHLHGLPQVVIAKDGIPSPQPYAVDTLNVAPGERYTVLIHAEEQFLDNAGTSPFAPLGVWAFHCHILNHAERDDGMFGMVTTFIVTP